MSTGGPNPVVLYGVVIQDALSRGNLDEMKRVATQARAHLDHYGDIAQGLGLLNQAIRGKEGPPVTALYAQALQDAVASGDESRIQAIREAAEQQIAQAATLRKALKALEQQIDNADKGD